MAVNIVESCMVTPPSGATPPTEALWLSNLDHMFREYNPMVFVYRRPPSRHGPKDFFSPEALKAALSKALVPFYPLAGRLAPDGAGRMEIRCSGDGVLFVTARTDATLDDMGDLAPSDQLRRTLVPSAEYSSGHAGVLVMLQVTFFKCGAVCLGTAFHHMVSDGRGFIAFINTWAAMVRGAGAAVPPPPFLDRTLLRARSPPKAPLDHAEEYGWPRGAEQPNKPKPPFATAIIGVSKHQVEALKRGAGVDGRKVPTFTALSAHAWRCACMARGLAGTETTRQRTAADARSRVRPPLPACYLGNALVRAMAVATVEDVVFGPLHATAATVAEATDRLTDDYVRSQVDWLEQCKGYREGSGVGRWDIPDTDLYVVSWLGLPYPEVDFGWGRPAFVGRATMRIAGAVYLVPRKRGGGGGLDVVVAMEPETLKRFKELFCEDIMRYSLAHGTKHYSSKL
ncbi:unnamed protein product [Urochloa decumbens]|uniref:Uncharacterized protein n=1 Tax=Urochloa decumbens TaxID=240449 RepID=A0ABC9B1L0_9POAL